MLRLVNRFDHVLSRTIHTSLPVSGSVFMKRQKKVDPEVAKVREQRKRKKLEREIRMMQKHSKKPKPVEEMAIDVKSAKNLHERVRENVTISEDVADERALIFKDYSRFCALLRIADNKWLRKSIQAQDNALTELKRLNPTLYEAAIQCDDNLLPRKIHGPRLTPPLKNYTCFDGEYIDTTKSWT